MKKRKIKSAPPEPPLGLDMPFDEALKRFIGTNLREVETSVKRVKKKKTLGGKKPPPSVTVDDVVSLPGGPARKRKYGT
jgi:hypothetical protein